MSVAKSEKIGLKNYQYYPCCELSSTFEESKKILTAQNGGMIISTSIKFLVLSESNWTGRKHLELYYYFAKAWESYIYPTTEGLRLNLEAADQLLQVLKFKIGKTTKLPNGDAKRKHSSSEGKHASVLEEAKRMLTKQKRIVVLHTDRLLLLKDWERRNGWKEFELRYYFIPLKSNGEYEREVDGTLKVVPTVEGLQFEEQAAGELTRAIEQKLTEIGKDCKNDATKGVIIDQF